MNLPPFTGHLVEYTRLGSPRVAWVAWWREDHEVPDAVMQCGGLMSSVRYQTIIRQRRDYCSVSGRLILRDEMRRTVMMRDGTEQTALPEFANLVGFLNEPTRVLRDLIRGAE